MSILPQTLYTRKQIQALETKVLANKSFDEMTLMQRAGFAVFGALKKNWTSVRSITVVCGYGNNGGDGYITAQIAKQQGIATTILYLRSLTQLAGPALKAMQACQTADIDILPFQAELLTGDVIIDAIFGIGLDRAIDADIAEVIRAINASNMPVLSIDIPTGIDADTGIVHGEAIIADATITVLGLKQGLMTGPAVDYVGQLLFDDLQIKDEINSAHARIDYDSCHSLLKPRLKSAHKGDYGHAIIMGGDIGFLGAAVLCASAALRAGAGLVSVITHANMLSSITNRQPELMCVPFDEHEKVASLCEKANVIAVGPGLGQAEFGQTLWQLALQTQKPLIVDADALNLLAKQPIQRSDWILTPHPGEASRLLQQTAKAINQDRFNSISKLQAQYGGHIVLKGAGTLIKADQENIYLCSDGNPGMASGGMGDLLTGIITGLVAQGFSMLEACQLGVCIHARAADIVAQNGQRGLLASDLLPIIRQLVNPV